MKLVGLAPQPPPGDRTATDSRRDARGSSSPPATYAGDVLGRYEILCEIGHGSLGTVYEARDRELGRTVALKRVRRDRRTAPLDEAMQKEAQAAARLQHENIVTIFDIGSTEWGPYLVYELLSGETLQAHLARCALPVPEAVQVGIQIARALVHAHHEGVLHRDLKPANVFLTRTGAAKVLDFGIAHVFGEPTAVCGTPAYMPPEQWRGEALDARADLFALGVTMYEALSGRRPYGLRDGRNAVLDGDPARPLDAHVPRRLRQLVERMIANDPDHRPRTAAAVLEELLAVERLIQRAPPRRTRALIGALALAGIVAAGAATWAWRQRAAPPPPVAPSIAVLPFSDFSPERDQAHFSDGIAEDIMNALSHVEGLRVVGRASSFSFRGSNQDLRAIGDKLGVATVLEGSVQKDGNRLRVTAQLVNVADGYQVWSASYDREVTGVFEVQDEIARAVVAALSVKLIPERSERRTITPEVYADYLLGKQLFSRHTLEAYQDSVAAFERVIARAPGYAPPWIGLARTLYMLAAVDTTLDSAGKTALQERARAAMERAMTISPRDADVYAVRATMRAGIDWDWEHAKEDARHALELAPQDVNALRAFGIISFYLGQHDAALESLLAVVRLEPLVSAGWNNIGILHMVRGDYVNARRYLQRALDITPGGYGLPFALGEVSLLEGDPFGALVIVAAERDARYRLIGEALAYHSLGRSEESLRARDALIEKYGGRDPYLVACVHAWRAENDEAFAWLERAFSQRDQLLAFIKNEPLLRSVRDDPRYSALLARMRLPVD